MQLHMERSGGRNSQELEENEAMLLKHRPKGMRIKPEISVRFTPRYFTARDLARGLRQAAIASISAFVSDVMKHQLL
jgi:hypothetical protein